MDDAVASFEDDDAILTREVFFLSYGDVVFCEFLLQVGYLKFCGVLGASNFSSLGGDRLLDIVWDIIVFLRWVGVISLS